MGKVIFALLLTTTSVLAMDEKIFINKQPAPNPITEEELAKVQPTEEAKKKALMRAYELNNKIMCCGFVDIDSGADDARPVKTERIIPIAKAEDKNEIDQAADIDKLQQKWLRLRGDKFAKTDVCTIHKMHKVTTSDGKSWKCRK